MNFSRESVVGDTGNKKIVADFAERLYAVSIGAVATYEELSAAAPGKELRGRDRHLILKAMDALNKAYGIVFKVEQNEGYRRLSHAEGIEYTGSRGLTKCRRASRVAVRRTTNALRTANDVSPEVAKAANQRLFALGMIEHLSMARTVRALPEHPARVDGLAPLRAALGIQ
jgi:hypothetical protein